MGPVSEEAGELFVDEEAVLFVGSVTGEPALADGAEEGDEEFDFGAGLEVARAAEDLDVAAGRSEEFEGVRAFVEGEDGLDRSVDEDRTFVVEHP